MSATTLGVRFCGVKLQSPDFERHEPLKHHRCRVPYRKIRDAFTQQNCVGFVSGSRGRADQVQTSIFSDDHRDVPRRQRL